MGGLREELIGLGAKPEKAEELVQQQLQRAFEEAVDSSSRLFHMALPQAQNGDDVISLLDGASAFIGRRLEQNETGHTSASDMDSGRRRARFLVESALGGKLSD